MFSEDSNSILRCNLRGKFKKDFNLKKDKLFLMDIAAVGDFVDYDINEDGTGTITAIDERKNYISRKAPKIKGASYRGERLEQVIAANIDNFIIVTSISQPPFNNKVLDRFLVTGESSNVDITILINKIDLDQEHIAEAWADLYSEIGYDVIILSAKKEMGLENIKILCEGKKNLFWGQSGVGKSTILNKLYPELNLKTNIVSTYNDKGKHTTVTSVMLKSFNYTYIIDTPGIREIDPFGIRKEDLSHYFIEFAEYAEQCRFNTCTHEHEPGCEVIKAVEEEKIAGERYDSYLRILNTIEEDINF